MGFTVDNDQELLGSILSHATTMSYHGYIATKLLNKIVYHADFRSVS